MAAVSDLSDLASQGRRARNSDTMGVMASLGLAARAVGYLLVAIVAWRVAFGTTSSEADQRGALQAVGSSTGGKLLLILLAGGFACYALWRLTEAALGADPPDDGAAKRFSFLLRGLLYVGLTVTALRVLQGSGGGSQAQQQQDWTSRALGQPGGRWLVGVIGLIVLGIGAGLVYRGLTRKFEKHLRIAEMSPRVHAVVGNLGRIGTTARGLVFGLVGILVIIAAAKRQPDKARGLDGALRTLAAQPYGTVLLVTASIGLLVFAAYGFAESRWHR